MAISAGTLVITAASLRSASAHGGLPAMGIVSAATPGAPPTAVTVVWDSTLQTTYATTGTGSTAVLLEVSGVADELVGAVVSINTEPNPGSRVQGPVVFHEDLLDPSTGVSIGAYVIVRTKIGYIAALASQVTVFPSA